MLHDCHIDTVFNRTESALSFTIALPNSPELIVQVEAQKFCVTLATDLPHMAAIEPGACILAASRISARGQHFTVSFDLESLRFGLNFAVPLAIGACLDTQLACALGYFHAVAKRLTPLLVQFGYGRLGLERVMLLFRNPGIGFDEPDSERIWSVEDSDNDNRPDRATGDSHPRA